MHGFKASDILRVEIDIFDVAFHIIGGGEEGDKTIVHTKEEADHSLHYMVSAAILDGWVMPEQYAPDRIRREDIQELLRKVTVRPDASCTARFPSHMPCRLVVHLRDGRTLTYEKTDYEGFHTNPLPWKKVMEKFEYLSGPHADSSLRQSIVQAVDDLEAIRVEELTGLLAVVGKEKG